VREKTKSKTPFITCENHFSKINNKKKPNQTNLKTAGYELYNFIVLQVNAGQSSHSHETLWN